MPMPAGWIDTHAHFWDRDLVRAGWNPPAPLDQTYAPDSWVVQIGARGVAGCIYVETGRTDAELEILARWSAEYAAVVGFIAPIAADASDVDAIVERWQGTTAFRGVRAHFQDSGADLLRLPQLVANLRRLADARVLYEFLVIGEQLWDVQRLCAEVPDLQVAIEHMGKPRITGPVDSDWRGAMTALAADTATVIKVSLSPRPDEFSELVRRGPAGFPLDGVRRHVDVLLELFGPERLVWGSDWPVSLLTAPTSTFVSAWETLLGPVGTGLAATARRVYQIADPAEVQAR